MTLKSKLVVTLTGFASIVAVPSGSRVPYFVLVTLPHGILFVKLIGSALDLPICHKIFVAFQVQFDVGSRTPLQGLSETTWKELISISFSQMHDDIQDFLTCLQPDEYDANF